MSIDLNIYAYPDCPKCGKELRNIINDTRLCSSPPYCFFKCDDCPMEGFVMLKKNPVYYEQFKDTDGVRFIPRSEILSPDHMINLKISESPCLEE